MRQLGHHAALTREEADTQLVAALAHTTDGFRSLPRRFFTTMDGQALSRAIAANPHAQQRILDRRPPPFGPQTISSARAGLRRLEPFGKNPWKTGIFLLPRTLPDRGAVRLRQRLTQPKPCACGHYHTYTAHHHYCNTQVLTYTGSRRR